MNRREFLKSAAASELEPSLPLAVPALPRELLGTIHGLPVYSVPSVDASTYWLDFSRWEMIIVKPKRRVYGKITNINDSP